MHTVRFPFPYEALEVPRVIYSIRLIKAKGIEKLALNCKEGDLQYSSEGKAMRPGVNV